MAGIQVFRALGEAIRAGFEIYYRTATGYVARARLNGYRQVALLEH